MEEITTEGKFLVLEGISGCGKGTQKRLIYDYLERKNSYNQVLMTREPTQSEYGQKARALMRQHKQQGENPANYAREYVQLFLEDRLTHGLVIISNLGGGVHVVCDRYLHSTVVYQQGPKLTAEEIIRMHDKEKVPYPDLTLIFDLPAEEALRRIESTRRTEQGVHEVLPRLQQNRERYLRLPALLPFQNIKVINALGTPEEIFRRYVGEMDKLF